MNSRQRLLCATLGVSLVVAAPAAAQTGTLGVDTANLDRAVRPQDDFFRFANGSWLRRTQIPSDRSRYGAFDELREQSVRAIRAIVEEAAGTADRKPGSDVQKVGDFYTAYMDSARVEALGIEPLRAELDRIARVSDKGELPALFAHLQRIGVQTPFGFFIGQDAKNATRYIASVSQGGLGMPDRDYYLKQDEKFARTRAEYARYIETLLRLSGERDAAAAAAAIVALESSLAEKHWDRARSRDREATYNLFEVAKLQSLTPGFAWSRFLEAAAAAGTPGVVVRQPDYLQALDQALARVPLQTWKQYLTYKLVHAYADQLSKPFVDARFAFSGRTLQGLEEQQPRWKRGINAVEDALGMVVGRVYVERHFRPEAKARMEKLVQNLIASFREGIDELEWMQPETKAQAKDKLAKFKVKIAYPDRWPDHSGLEVRPGDLVGNVMRARRFEFERMVGRLGKPIDRDHWGMTPQTVNAYYSSSMNEIVFPAAILQPPFFSFEADDAVNYGAIGAVIGHEIGHGFDDQGSRSDGDGNLRNWWTDRDAQEFKQRTDALVEAYGAFQPLPGQPINGRLTLGENIGDLSGLAVAYKAYRRSLGGKPAPVIGGFTGDQRFFLGWAQIWRTVAREESLRQQLLTDSHSPGEFRVNGVLRNLPEFYAAFGVGEGDRMWVPAERRVKIW